MGWSCMVLQDWTGEDDLSDALIATAHRLPKAKFIITTLGKKGAVLLERGTEEAAKGACRECGSLLDILRFLRCCALFHHPCMLF
eukprot:1137844-Pelagomonas_calceolata.AAC.6